MIRNMEKNDLNTIRTFIKKCKPLGMHTLYTYWVLTYHFNDLFLLSEDNSQINGIITGLVSSKEDKTAFIWQIGVDPEFRGRGISQLLISAFCTKAQKLGIEHIEFSIDPQNTASLHAFRKYAKSIHKEIKKTGNVHLDDDYMDYPENEDMYTMELI